MLKLFLIQFYIISIIFLGYNEIFIINLSIIVFIIIIVFFNRQIIINNYIFLKKIFLFIYFNLYIFFIFFMFLRKLMKHTNEIKWCNNKNYSTIVVCNNPSNIIEIHPHFFELGKIDGKYVILKGFVTHQPVDINNVKFIVKDFNGKFIALQLDKVEYEFIKNKEYLNIIIDNFKSNFSDKLITNFKNINNFSKDLGEVLQIYFWEQKGLQLTDISQNYETCNEFILKLNQLEFNDYINND